MPAEMVSIGTSDRDRRAILSRPALTILRRVPRPAVCAGSEQIAQTRERTEQIERRDGRTRHRRHRVSSP